MKNLVLVCSIFFSTLSFGQHLNIQSVAFQGYDIVAYYTLNQAIQGTDKLSLKIDEVHYYFSSQENLMLFNANPQKYTPKYGGWCAIGIAIYDGQYPVDPESFLFDDGELYLFCPGEIDNWIADQENLKKQADIEWAKIIANKND